jgi:hypothetical protein
MSTARKSTTRSYRRHNDAAATPAPTGQGKEIIYDRVLKDFLAYFNGNFLGSRPRYAEAAELADAAAYEDARRAGYAEGFRAALAVL